MKTIRAKQAKVHSAYFVQREQHAIIAKDNLTQSPILVWRFPRSCRRSFLNSLIIESLRKHDVGGSDNVIWKSNFAFLQSFLNYSK